MLRMTFALFLITMPAVATAQSCSSQTPTCADGEVWDAETSKCVQQITS